MPIAAGVVAAFVRLPDDPTVWDRIIQGGLVALGGFIAAALLAFLYAVVVAPYQQRNALREEIRLHVEREHPPKHLIISFKEPSVAKRWVPAEGEVYTLIEIPVGLILNETPYRMSLQFHLDGEIEGVRFVSDLDLWTRIEAKYPEMVSPYLGNPIRAETNEDTRGVIPFLAPGNDDIFDKPMDYARIVVVDLLTETGQWIAAPGSEFRWPHPGFGNWNDESGGD